MQKRKETHILYISDGATSPSFYTTEMACEFE